jgi:hypothetical protein
MQNPVIKKRAPDSGEDGSSKNEQRDLSGSFHGYIITSRKVLESNVRFGISVPPMSKCQSLLVSLWDSWTRSTVRQVVNEVGNFYRRMAEILGNESLRHGELQVAMYPGGSVLDDLSSEYTYLDACNMGIQQLRNQIQWFGLLEVQIASRSFLLGATWAAHSVCNGKRNQSVAASYDSSRNGNSMPPSATLQDSKRGS